MSTINLWLLISLPGFAASYANVPTTLVERFATAQECERVLAVILGDVRGHQPMRCVQATIAITKVTQ